MKFFHVIWGQLVVAVVIFASIRIYTELMDAETFGAAMLGIGVIAFLESLVSMALNQTQIALCAKLPSGEERRQMSVGLAYLLQTFLAPIALLLAVACLIATPFLPGALYAAIATIALFCYFAGEALKYSLMTLLVLDQQYRRQSLWNAGETVLTFAGIIAALLLFGADAWTFLAAHIVVRIFSALLFTILFGGVSHLRGIRLGRAKARWREALGHGLPVSAMGPLGWISSFLDRFIIGGILGTAATGSYVAATGLVGRPYALTTAILSNYFRPHLFTASGNEKRQSQITMKWLAAAAVVGLGGALALLLVGPFILHFLLAADYRDGAVALMVTFAIAQTLSIMTHAIDNNLLASSRSASLLKVQTVMSVSTLAIIPVGTVLLGPLGATIARCVAEALKLFATYLLMAGFIIRKSEPASLATERNAS
ncbi:oligosaccharide flippase family protein [Aliirhizobium terrae]|uniref:lipopolysaccharide biosynthesis protein n=1 Tax=Terrirhizobium terrae TaxID=2926709 RepID=UPI002575860D|nr:oligosaccharide flippase family protein [Rhizobium sp. CC-CFT758]WJH39669.1 oligosaccharide flippase family protein [Rhizobium sp. CC-CFT758]